MTFGQELILAAIQTLGLGVVIVLIGFFLNKKLEKFKTQQALNSEFNKLKVQKIAEVAALASKTEHLAIQIIQVAQQIKDKGLQPKEYNDEILKYVTPIESQYKSLRKEFRETAINNHFWLGQKLFLDFKAYSEELKKLHEAYLDGGNLEEINDRIIEKRVFIENYLS